MSTFIEISHADAMDSASRPDNARGAIQELQRLNEWYRNTAWVDENQTAMEYSALLTRVSRDYDRRFT